MKIKFVSRKIFAAAPETQFRIGPDSLESIKYDFYIKIVPIYSYCILFKYTFILIGNLAK
jgi:hypothetical protein